MRIGFDINRDDVVSSTKNTVEPLNIVDTENAPDIGGGNRTDSDYMNPNRSWTSEEVIPNIDLSKDAKKSFIESLPEDKKPYAYLGIGALIYYLFLS